MEKACKKWEFWEFGGGGWGGKGFKTDFDLRVLLRGFRIWIHVRDPLYFEFFMRDLSALSREGVCISRS